jgi:hypothetical protein
MVEIKAIELKNKRNSQGLFRDGSGNPAADCNSTRRSQSIFSKVTFEKTIGRMRRGGHNWRLWP